MRTTYRVVQSMTDHQIKGLKRFKQIRPALEAQRSHNIYLSNQALCMLKQELVEKGITLAIPSQC